MSCLGVSVTFSVHCGGGEEYLGLRDSFIQTDVNSLHAANDFIRLRIGDTRQK